VAFGVARFEEFELDCGRYELRQGDHVVKLEKIPMEILTLLIEANGQLVARDQIIERIWGKDIFLDTEHGINTAVRKIRQALGDDPDQPRYIQTVTGRGYRFIAPVAVIGEALNDANNGDNKSVATESTEVRQGDSKIADQSVTNLPPATILSSRALRTGSMAIAVLVVLAAALAAFNVHNWRYLLVPQPSSRPIHALAVLPLENLSGDPEQDYFADGMTDELITMIAQNTELRVISRTSAMQYKNVHRPLPDIARELGVDGILEGSVGRFGNQVHINAQLIYAPTDTHMWAESYDRSLSDIGSLQTELSRTIARQVGSRVSVSRRPERRIDPGAHDAYLLGRQFWFAHNMDQSRTQFQKAIDLQPDYAAAWSGLADSYTESVMQAEYPPGKIMPLAEEAARKALQFDDSLAEAHSSVAAIDIFYRWDWSGADKESARAIQLNPGFAEGHRVRSYVLTSLNRLDEAVQEQKKAMELDPLTNPAGLGYALVRARQFEAAVNEARVRLATQPNNADLHYLLAFANFGKDSDIEGEPALEQALRLSGGQKLAEEDHRAYAHGGMQEVWDCNLKDLKRRATTQNVSPVEFANNYGWLRRKEETLHYIELAYKQGGASLVWMQSDGTFVFLHAEPRYRDIVNKMGLPPAY
jgi:TolB-like protein/DNA-binding winged helix-turn-helix (wHTH) protein